MNTTATPHYFPSSTHNQDTIHKTVTLSQMRPRYIDKCVENNPRQIVQVDILGDVIQLPVYALRRRNAMVHI
jgi:hypothetical protein